LERWADEHSVELLFIGPGDPTQNGFIESFNAPGRRQKSAQMFLALYEATAIPNLLLASSLDLFDREIPP
jgi:transposase InsO family protein